MTSQILNSAVVGGKVKSLKLHFIGMCGKGMAPIAAALAQEGWTVTGSDEGCYAPMSEYLEDAGLTICTPYDERNIPSDTDLVVVGKRVNEDNPELVWVRKTGIPYRSFPQFLLEYVINASRNAVVAGALGKTTTTAMLTWILECAGKVPNYFIGGIARNMKQAARLRDGAKMTVLEGDEYASCFDDERPKFLHYQPEVALITNVVEEHPDVYDGMEALSKVFVELVRLVPQKGLVILWDEDEVTPLLKREALSEVVLVGFGPTADARITEIGAGGGRVVFEFEGVRFDVPCLGRMNIRNAAMAAVAARHFGVKLSDAALALGQFAGVENRQEKYLVGTNIVVKDKATHPRALRELFQAIRQEYPERRLVSFIQPRATGGRDWVYQRELPEVLSTADKVVLLEPYEHKPSSSGGDPSQAQRGFCADLLAEKIQHLGTEVLRLENTDVGRGNGALKAELKDGDVLVLTLPEQAREIRNWVLVELSAVRVLAEKPSV